MRTFLLIVTLLFVPISALAASVVLTPPTAQVRVGDEFVIPVILATEGGRVNAFEGSLRISTGLQVDSIHVTGSIVPLWLTAPHLASVSTVEYAGVIPGGLSGTGGLFTLVVTATKVGRAQITSGSDTRLFADDGEGTPVVFKARTILVDVAAASGVPTRVVLEDSTQPESFVPEVVPASLYGKEGEALIFATQDKDSGVAHYAVAGSRHRSADPSSLLWHIEESPYFLKPGDAVRYLYVQAVDSAGNQTIVRVAPQSFSIITFVVNYWPYIFLVLLVLVILTRVLRGRFI